MERAGLAARQSFAVCMGVLTLLIVATLAEAQQPTEPAQRPDDPVPVPGGPPVVIPEPPIGGGTGGDATDDGPDVVVPGPIATRRPPPSDRRPVTRRSAGRTAAGVSLLGAGVYTAVFASRVKSQVDRRVPGDSIAQGVSKKHYEYVGLGMMGLGVLLATVWSDVEVSRVADIVITPGGGVMASRSFGW